MGENQLIQKCKELNALQVENALFYELNSLNQEKILELESRFDHQNVFKPVNFLRFLVARLLRQGAEISREKLEILKSAIQERNILEFYPEASESLLESLREYKTSDKGMFPQWKEPFPILYQFFYTNQEKVEVIQSVKDYGNEVIRTFNLENTQVHAVGFDGPQNYGSDEAWGAIIPSNTQDVQHSFQLFFRFSERGVNGGLYRGHKVKDIPYQQINSQFGSWKEYLSSLEELIPTWKELNSRIDFSLQEEENKFSKRIKSFDSKDVNVFFNVLNWLISDLEISDGENLVFSTGSKQLSFQVGKRYCLVLDKKGFGFITPEGTKVPNARNSSFEGIPKAGFINETHSQNLLEFYTEMATSVQFEIERDNHAKEKEYDNPIFRKAAFDRDYRSKFFDFKEIDRPIFSHKTPNINSLETMAPDLNQIFFGPPGTGKTFHTIDEAVKIVSPNRYKEIQHDRKELRKEYEKKFILDWEASNGQIGFCTFHQSFSYEDFVEGIKPLNPEEGDTYLKYETQEGIFKRICRLAEDSLRAASNINETLLSLSQTEFDQASFYKISLGEANAPTDQEIYDYCMDKGLISIGFGPEIDLSGKNETEVSELYSQRYKDGGAQFLNYFKNYLKVGNYVLVSRGNHYVRAMGKVTGEYFFDPTAPIRYKHFRKVDWIFKNQEIPIQELYEKSLSQQTTYRLKKEWIKSQFFVIDTAKEVDIDSKDPKNYVLVIDEINRGNVASIFGELITLIETDKRAGKREEIKVVLPYSKQKFSVPSNLYIIGTMNTADRSIEALDTALRRRFSFREMSSNPGLLRTEGKIGEEKGGLIEGIDVVLMLEKINERIEKLIDKDHKIGHAYFMGDITKEDLQRTFKNKVIPLLEEYFFGDFGKIGLVLGSTFIGVDHSNEFDFADFKVYDANITADLKQRKVYKIKPMEDWNFSSIYK
jgi:5-methylcytosine-specific restriction endonuclease McrBC GTP-binding regulatory subunit McrB